MVRAPALFHPSYRRRSAASQPHDDGGHDPEPCGCRECPHRLDGQVLSRSARRRADRHRGDAGGAGGEGYPTRRASTATAQVAGWRQVTRTVHAAGGRIFLQLWHVGRVSHPSMQPAATAGVALGHRPGGDVYTQAACSRTRRHARWQTDEVAGVVAQFRGRRASAPWSAGFDGVEIHGANGYLIDQFLRDGTNQRTDGYGGSSRTALRFLLEVTEAVVAVWGADRVGVRLSPRAVQRHVRLGSRRDVHRRGTDP